MKKAKYLIGLVSVALLIQSCGNRLDEENNSPVVASTGNAKLHLNELNLFIMDNPGLEISKVQLSNYIQRWSEKELVYHQAVAEEFHKHPDIQTKVNELVKDFVVAAYLHENVDSKVKISDTEIRSYYNKRAAEEFERKQDFYNVDIILVATYAEAARIRQLLQGDGDFETLAKENSLDVSRDNGGHLGWVTENDLPNEVARRVRTQSVKEVSTPVKSSLGYFLVLVNEVRKKGETQTLEEVRDQIEWRIRAKAREDDYKELINQLKENQKVTFNWNYLDSLNWERK